MFLFVSFLLFGEWPGCQVTGTERARLRDSKVKQSFLHPRFYAIPGNPSHFSSCHTPSISDSVILCVTVLLLSRPLHNNDEHNEASQPWTHSAGQCRCCSLRDDYQVLSALKVPQKNHFTLEFEANPNEWKSVSLPTKKPSSTKSAHRNWGMKGKTEP